MKVLLDTHVLLWGLADDPRLTRKVRSLLADDGVTLLWSAASTWELAVKASLGRIRFSEPLAEYLPAKLSSEGIIPLPITSEHAVLVENLPFHHRDPFDRLLIAQAKSAAIPIVSSDRLFRRYQVETIW